MPLLLTRTQSAIGPNLTSAFAASGGTPGYFYAVLPGGAGGTIDHTTGVYTAPAVASSDPKRVYDTIRVTDAVGATATARVLVGSPLLLLCDVIQTELGLTDGRVFLWDQKDFQPTDAGLYISIAVGNCKPFGNTIRPSTNGWNIAVQIVNMLATVEIDIMSRGPDARDRKEEVILALNSLYAQAQQEVNGFYIGKLSPGSQFVNLSMIDGAAIPYRYRISINIQYAVKKSKAVPYFDTFEDASVVTDP